MEPVDSGPQDWARYWRDADRPLEAMHAHFRRHVYHRHSHGTYSFGVTEQGAQAFRCRGAERTSAAGMVMAFNPDDAHDGRTATEPGFTYRIVHIGPELVREVLAGAAGRPVGLPLFAEPVVHDPVLAGALRRLHAVLGAAELVRDERLTAAVLAMAARGATRPPTRPERPAAVLAVRARALLEAAGPLPVAPAELAAAAGASRYAVYRAFREAYGMAPSDYQRQLRLRTARRLMAGGMPTAEAAPAAGFADQAHLTRWFVRYFGVTPGAWRRAVG